jgi:[ribosomal protein S18]-alanine N-acetyltransferase
MISFAPGEINAAMTTPIQIREWREDDFDALHALDRACFPPPIAYSRRTLRKFLRLPGAQCLVAKCEAPIAGFILIHAASHKPRTIPTGHIISLDVDETFRRGGVGSALLHAAEKSLAACGVREVDLETAVDNHAAIAFWQRRGYSIIGRIKDYYDDGADAFAMSRVLPPLQEFVSQEGASTCTYTKPSFSPSSRA